MNFIINKVDIVNKSEQKLVVSIKSIKMRKLNLNSNNNKYVQMKQSGFMEKSYTSEHSDVLSLTSNNSDFQVNNSQNQIELFKHKISHLLGTHQTQTLEDLYSIIKQKVGSNLIQQTSKELNQMQAALGRVKQNNRQMAKLVSVMGTKSLKQQPKSSIKQEPKSNKKEQTKIHQNKKHFRNENKNSQQQQSQLYNYQYKNSRRKNNRQNQQNQSQQNQSQRYRNSKSFQSSKNERQKSYQQKGENERIRYLDLQIKQSFEQQYRWKNRIYEQKVKEMLMELGNIKKQLNSTHNQPNYESSQNKNYIKSDNNEKRNSFDSRLNQQQKQSNLQQQQKQDLQQIQAKSKQIDFVFNPKTAVSEQISAQNINYFQREDMQQKQTKKSNNKNSFQTTNSYQNQVIKNKTPQNLQGNAFLIQKAKSISKRLQQIKAELTQTTSRTPFHSNHQIRDQKTNIQLLASNNFNSQNYQNFQSFKNGQLGQQSNQGLQLREIQNDQNYDNEKQEHPVSIERLHEQALPKHKLTKKKSVLDQMKNVESKIIISQKHLHDNPKWDSMKNHKRVETPNFSTVYSPNLPSQNISKPNISSSLSKSNEKQHMVSYSVINPSNSFKNLPHNTSIMNYRPPINKQQSVNSSLNYNPPLGPYETSHVFPVTKFNRHRMFQNQTISKSSSINHLPYPPLIIQHPQSQNMGPILNRSGSNIKIGRSLSQKRLSNNSINLPYQNFPPKIATSPGIRITKMTDTNKGVPQNVTLGSSSRKLRSASNSKDSKDLTRSKGINISSKQNR